MRTVAQGAALPLPAADEWRAPDGAPAAPGDPFAVAFPDSPVAVHPSAPVIAEWSRTVMPGESFTMTGTRFTTRTGEAAGSDTTLWVWAANGAAGTLRQAQVWMVRDLVVVATLPHDIPFGMVLVWLENVHGPSAPICLNRTEPQWLGPLGDTAQPGSSKRVFGKNLSHGHGTNTACVYLQPASGGDFTACAVTNVEPYAVAFTVPPGLTNGTYHVYAHNGHGGSYGWGGPLPLTVTNAWTRGANERLVLPSGGDDWSALQSAIDAITALPGGGTVRLTNGTYRIGRQLNIRDQVRLIGAGVDETSIEIRLTVAGQHSGTRFYGRHVTVQGLTFLLCESTEAPGYGIINSEWPGMNEWLELRNVCWRGETHTDGRNMAIRARVAEVVGCRGYRCLGLTGNDIWVHHSVFYGGPYGGPDIGGTGCGLSGGGSRSIIERNLFETDWPTNAAGSVNYLDFMETTNLEWKIWCPRVLVKAVHYGSEEHAHIAWNTALNVASDRGQEEMILFHGSLSPNVSNWYAQVTASDGTTTTFRTDGLIDGVSMEMRGYPPGTTVPDTIVYGAVDGGAFAVIAGGTGLGQARRVVRHTTNTVTVAQPWRVPPAADSKIILMFLMKDQTVYNNRLDAFPPGYTNTRCSSSRALSFWMNCFGSTAEDNVSRRTYTGSDIWGNGVCPSYWNEIRDAEEHDIVRSGPLMHAQANPSTVQPDQVDALGPYLLGNAVRGGIYEVVGPWEGCSYDIGLLRADVRVYPDPAGPISCAHALEEGNLFEHITAYGSKRGMDVDPWCRNLFRANSVAVSDVTVPNNDPPVPQPVFIHAGAEPLFSGNTYAGGATDYYAGGGATLGPMPVALFRTARFEGSPLQGYGEVTIAVANAGTLDMDWNAATTDAWIQVSLTNDASLPPESTAGLLHLEVQPSGLAKGLHWGLVTVHAGSQSCGVGVRLLATNDVYRPSLILLN